MPCAAGTQQATKVLRVGVLVGSAIGGLEHIEDSHTVLLERGPSRVSPFTVPMMIGDMAAGQISIAIGARGPNYSIASACARMTGTSRAWRCGSWRARAVPAAGRTRVRCCRRAI